MIIIYNIILFNRNIFNNTNTQILINSTLCQTRNDASLYTLGHLKMATILLLYIILCVHNCLYVLCDNGQMFITHKHTTITWICAEIYTNISLSVCLCVWLCVLILSCVCYNYWDYHFIWKLENNSVWLVCHVWIRLWYILDNNIIVNCLLLLLSMNCVILC